MRIFSPMALVLIYGLAPLSYSADEPKKADKHGVAVGKQLPTHVVDFVNGDHKGHCGCPSVMLANAKKKGIIIWTRDSDATAFALAKSLDEKAIDGKKLDGYLVAFDMATDTEAEKAKELKHMQAGHARHAAKDMLDQNGVDAKSLVLVFFVNADEIKSVFSFAKDELTEAKIVDLTKEAAKFAEAK